MYVEWYINFHLSLAFKCWDRANQDKLEIREGEYFDDVKYEESIIDVSKMLLN